MEKRHEKKHNLRRVLIFLLIAAGILLVVAAICTVKYYMKHTGTNFSTALRETSHLGMGYLSNSLASEDTSIPVNPYKSGDYYYRGDLKHCTASEVSCAGIDVSSHQQQIDWTAVAEAGVDFAIIRVGYRGYTEGDIFPDSCAEQNLQGALDAGLDVGVYFFSQATTIREAREEARFVLDAIADYDISYPVLYDWEGITSNARTDDVTGEEMTQFALAFCEEIRNGGYTAGVYFNQSYGYNSFDLRALREYEFWLAEYRDVQSFAYEVQLWQYDCEARLPGIETPVDLNLCYKKYPIKPEQSGQKE